MKRHRLWIVGVLCLGLFLALGWRGRHRIRQFWSANAEKRQRGELQIEADPSSLPAVHVPPVHIAEGDWPWWRGPGFANHATGPLPPLNWSETENLVWKTPVPGRGHSSPCVLGNRIFLTTAMESEKSESALCLDMESGEVIWSKRVHQGEFIYKNQKNSHASSTPATDGERVFVLFAIDGAIWLSALSLEGEILWQCEAGPYLSKEGFGASPVVVGDVVVVAADCVSRSWMAAVHRVTGEILWRTPRGSGTSYGGPTLLRDERRDLVLMAGLDRVAAIDPADGHEAWSHLGPNMSASTPAFGGGVVIATGCTQDSGLFAIRVGQPPETLWHLPLKVEVPSPLIADGLVYLVQDIGVMLCCDALSGETIWKKRLGGNVSSSPLLIEDRILVALEDGRTLVLKAGREYEQLAENRVECEGLYATPVVTQGQVILRTTENVYVFGEKAPPADVNTPQPEQETGRAGS